MQRVRTDVSNGELNLYFSNGNYRSVDLEAHITVLDLKEIKNSGIGDMYITNNYDAEIFKLFNSGFAYIYLEGSSDYLIIRGYGNRK